MPNNFSLIVDGRDRLIQAFTDLDMKSTSRVITKISRAADATLAGARSTVRVATGRLYASGNIQSVPDGFEVSFGGVMGNGRTSTIYTYPANALGGDMQADGYAWFNELGTSKMSASPYLGPAFEEQSQVLVTSLGDILGG